jgi:intron-binding protein aquarius
MVWHKRASKISRQTKKNDTNGGVEVLSRTAFDTALMYSHKGIQETDWPPLQLHCKDSPGFDAQTVVDVYTQELWGTFESSPSLKKTTTLEISQYLEHYLWPNFNSDRSTPEHVLSIVTIINEKSRRKLPTWSSLNQWENIFPTLCCRIVSLREERRLKLHEDTSFVVFLTHCYQSLEHIMVRVHFLKLISLPMWHSISHYRLKLELYSNEHLAKYWKHLSKKEAKSAKLMEVHVPFRHTPEAWFLPSLIDGFLGKMISIKSEAIRYSGKERLLVIYCEKFVELLIDLISQVPTRRFFHTVIADRAVLIKCKMSNVFCYESKSVLFGFLLDLFHFYMDFELDNHTGEPYSEDDNLAKRHDRIQQCQRLIFIHSAKLRELSLLCNATVSKRNFVFRYLNQIQADDLFQLTCHQMHLLSEKDPFAHNTKFLLEAVASQFERPKFDRRVIDGITIYPTEDVLFNQNAIPLVHYMGENCLALPKLNLQFLSFYDYLFRNFTLFKLESMYKIGEDIFDVIRRVSPSLNGQGASIFTGWSRMGVPIISFAVTEVKRQLVNRGKSMLVSGEVVFSLELFPNDIRHEWDGIRQHDVLFLLTLKAYATEQQVKKPMSAAEKMGLMYMRGCEVVELKDEEDELIDDVDSYLKFGQLRTPVGLRRTITVRLDPVQYTIDSLRATGEVDAYNNFNLLVRRDAKENNFKAVLESIRDLMKDDSVVPTWLHDVFLGYGDPNAVQPELLTQDWSVTELDMRDTFIDEDHIREALGGIFEIDFMNVSRNTQNTLLLKLKFQSHGPFLTSASKKHPDLKTSQKNGDIVDQSSKSNRRPKVTAQAYEPVSLGPYSEETVIYKKIRFTSTQLRAIMSGLRPGLTMVVGPPGTG